MEAVPDIMLVMEAVPDDVVVNEIMPRLDCTSTKQLFRTIVLLPWRKLWNQHRDLIFSDTKDLKGKKDLNGYISCIDNTIKQCHTYLNLKKFKLGILYSSRVNDKFKSLADGWIRHAIERNVEEFNLKLCDVVVHHGFHIEDARFFDNSCITRMKLAYCQLNPPNGAISWKKLESLCLFWMRLDDDIMKKIFSGSPRLKSLELVDCSDYRQIYITSKSVKKFVFSRFHATGAVVLINAPQISSLTIKGKLLLEKLVLHDMFTLKQAELDYSMDYSSVPLETQERIFQGLMERLNDVKGVNVIVNNYCWEIYNRLKDRGVELMIVSVKAKR